MPTKRGTRGGRSPGSPGCPGLLHGFDVELASREAFAIVPALLMRQQRERPGRLGRCARLALVLVALGVSGVFAVAGILPAEDEAGRPRRAGAPGVARVA